MRYLLLISADEQTAERAMAEGDFGSFEAWYDDLTRRGVLEAHVGLHPSHTATTVRVRDGDVLLTDGPFAEGREQVGGLALINCRDLDEAVEIAAAHPATAVGQAEIRPVREAAENAAAHPATAVGQAEIRPVREAAENAAAHPATAVGQAEIRPVRE